MEQNHCSIGRLAPSKVGQLAPRTSLKLQRIGKDRHILNVLPPVLMNSRHAHLTKGIRVGIGVRKATNGCESRT